MGIRYINHPEPYPYAKSMRSVSFTEMLTVSAIILIFACLVWSATRGAGSQETKVVDGCEYLVTTSWVNGGPVRSLAHKGNCTNAIHSHNQ